MDELRELADRFYEHATSDSPLGSMWDGKLEHLAEWDDFTPEAVAGRKAKYLSFASEAETLDISDDPYDVALRDTIVAEAGAARDRAARGPGSSRGSDGSPHDAPGSTTSTPPWG